MKVLFAHSFYMAFDEKQQLAGQPYPPLGTMIAAAMAREGGHTVGLFDAMVAANDGDFVQRLNEGWDAVVIFEDNFNWLSKMCLNRMREACQRMIGESARRQIPVFVAGSDASDFPEIFLNAGARFVVKGEAEFRMLELLNDLASSTQEASEKPGVFRLNEGKVEGKPPQRGERDLSRFPPPAWDLVNLQSYQEIWGASKGYFSLNMMTTRGCPYRCNWCAKPIHGRRYDVRDPTAVAEELLVLKKKYDAEHIWFTDDIFGLKPKWLKAFADTVVELDATLPYMIQARADLVDPAFVLHLRRSGCKTVWMGVESGSQKVLDAMDKDLKLQQVYHATRLLQEAEIEVCFFLQFGYPGEEEEDIIATWKMIQDLHPHQIGISVAYPLPGTPFHEKVKDTLGERDHWEHSHTMRPVHPAAYPADFYPVLYNYFHQNFALLKGKVRTGLRGWKDMIVRKRTAGKLKRFGFQGVPFL